MANDYRTQALNVLLLRLFDKALLIGYGEFQKQVFDLIKKGTDKDEALLKTLASLLNENVRNIYEILIKDSILNLGDFINRVTEIARDIERNPSQYTRPLERKHTVTDLQAKSIKLRDYLQAEYVYLRSQGADDGTAILGAVKNALEAKLKHFQQEGFSVREASEMAKRAVDREAKPLWGDQYVENPYSFLPNPPPERTRYLKLFRYYRGKGYKPRDAAFAAVSQLSAKAGVTLEDNPSNRSVRGKWVICAKCGKEDSPSKATVPHRTGTSVKMRCVNEGGRALLCRFCCPTGHGTRFTSDAPIENPNGDQGPILPLHPPGDEPPIQSGEGGTMFTGAGIPFFRLLSLQKMLKLEGKGLRFRISVLKQVKNEFKLKGSRTKIEAEFDKIVNQAKAEMDKIQGRAISDKPKEVPPQEFQSNPSPLKFIILHANNGNPVRVVDRKPPKSFRINGKPWDVLKVDRDLVWALPRGTKFNDNPSAQGNPEHEENPLEKSGRPFWGEEQAKDADRANFLQTLRKMYPHLAGYTNEQLEAMLRVPGGFPSPQPAWTPAQPPMAQMAPPVTRTIYAMYHADTKTPLGDAVLYELPQAGETFAHGSNEYRIIKVMGSQILVKPRYPFRYGLVGLVKDASGQWKTFDIRPFHNRREAIGKRHQMKYQMQQKGYKLRGGYVQVLIVPWHKVVKYQPGSEDDE